MLLFTGIANAQIVNIPDANFKAKLLEADVTNNIAGNLKIDTNDNGEIEVSEATLITALNVSSVPGAIDGIQDFTGINSFVNLQLFSSSFNNATINIDGLTSLHTFNFSNNFSTSNTSVFTNLPSLTNFYYQQSSVNSIVINNCPNIQKIWVQQNANLTSLTIDSIPALKQLWGWGSGLLSINIPNSPVLEELDLHSNFTISSVSIGNSPLLKILNLSNNAITDVSGFINNLNNIEELRLDGNVIPNLILPVSMPNLRSISFNGTSNNNLNFANSPNLQGLSIISGDMSIIDLTNVPQLYGLVISDNPITSLNLSNNNLINSLSVLGCPISTLDLSNLSNLINASFRGLLISDLDLSNSPLVSSISFHDNPNLTHVNLKSGVANTINYNISTFYNVPNLQFICIDEGDVINYSIIQNPPVISTSSYCSFTPGGNYNTISGNVKFDADDNGCDTNDTNFPNIRVNINDGTTTGASFTDANGNYKFYTQAGNFAITPAIENPTWFNFSPTTANVVFANNNNNTSVNDFCLSANGVHPDLEIVITPVIPARPGFEAVYKIVYKNKGNQTLSQQYGINFFYNQNLMQYVTSSVATSQSGVGSLSWDYTALHPFESRAILVIFLINPPTDNVPVNIGDELTFTASIMPQSGDENTIDNLFILNQTVVGSYDPNDITCLEGDVVSPTEIGNYLHYNVRFENTGTAPAENIVAKVVVNSTDFDINSLQLMNTSHPVDARINGNIVEFIFQSINLESGGHGNVLLKVKSKSNLQQGDVVEKKANIYFDYNFPVETNNAETVFQLLNNPGFEQDNTIKIHPNPAQNTVYINGDFSIKTVELYDAQGRLLQSSMINENATTIDITNKSKGVYFVKVSSDKGIKVEKLVKN